MMLKKISETVFFLFLITIGMQASAQTFWSRTFDNFSVAYSIQTTSDNGSIVGGKIVSSIPPGFNDVWILKLDSVGNVQWQKSYGGSNADDHAVKIRITSDGGYIVAGVTSSFGAGGEDVWILKLDSSGNLQWQKTFGGSAQDLVWDIQTTSDNGYAVAAQTDSFGAGNVDVWILKLNSSGDIVWQNTYGGATFETCRSIQTTSDGGFLVGGMTDLSGDDFWILKLDSAGSVLWQKTYGDINQDVATSMQTTSDGGAIVVGASVSFSAGSGDFWVLKLDSSGNIQWQKAYGGVSNEYPFSIQTTSDGGYIVGGRSMSFGLGGEDAWILKLNSSGGIQWQKSYGGSNEDIVFSVQQTLSGGFLAAGSTFSFGNFNIAAWILSLDSNGDIDPSCTLDVDTSIVPLDSTATVGNSSITPASSNANLSSTNALAADTTAEAEEQCPAPTCIFCDDFGGTTPPADWMYPKPSWIETGGHLVGTPQGKKAEAIASPAFSGCSTCTVETVMMSAGGENSRIFLLAWYQNKLNTIELLMKEESDTLVLKQRAGGSIVTKMKFGYEISPNIPLQVELRFDGTNIVLSVNGTQVGIIPVAVTPNGTVGFRVKNTTGSFDYISVN